MLNYRDTFKRKEVKYVLDRRKRAAIEDRIEAHLSKSVWGESAINSLYLDTKEHELISRSLEKPIYKEKLRLRWYGATNPTDAQDVFIELKKKFKGIVYKRRIALRPSELQSAFEGLLPFRANTDSIPRGKHALVQPARVGTELQIEHELATFYDRHPNLSPSALITCERIAYESADGSLRITFDANLKGSDLFSGVANMSLLAPGSSVMEIKCMGAYPQWLVEVLSEQSAYPRSFSKYGEMYKKGALENAG